MLAVAFLMLAILAIKASVNWTYNDSNKNGKLPFGTSKAERVFIQTFTDPP